MYKDGLIEALSPVTSTNSYVSTATNTFLMSSSVVTNNAQGYIQELRMYSRLFDLTDILRYNDE